MKGLNTKIWFLKLLFLTIVFFFDISLFFAQPVLPQRTVTVTATQAINFGTFYITGSSGGTITVGYDGSRTSTGDVALLAISPTAQPAIFEVKLCQGRNITVTFDATSFLSGNNGGSLTFDIGPTEKGGNNASFIVNSDCNFITPLRVGGTLHIPSGTVITGIYSGSFDITFNQN